MTHWNYRRSLKRFSHDHEQARSSGQTGVGLLRWTGHKLFASLMLLAFVLCLGCQVKVSRKQQASGKSNATVKMDAVSQLGVRVVGGEPFRYQTEISWPPHYTHVSVLINGVEWFKEETPKGTSFFASLTHNTDYNIELIARDSATTSEEKSMAQWQIKTPMDLVLNPTVLAESLARGQREFQSDRLFLSKPANQSNFLVSNGFDLIFNTNELIADEAIFATFPKGQKAGVNQAGRDGGTIFIKATRARGHLLVEMRGEHGGDGRRGDAYVDRAPQGAPGIDGQGRCQGGGRHGIPECWCSRKPGNGGPGQAGEIGHKGYDGRRGGTSGKFRLEIAETSPDLLVDVIVEKGIAGAPGEGGDGQLGGLGGPPGQPVAPDCRFSNPLPGPEGAQGPKGESGGREADGEIQKECISIGEGFGRCSS